MADSLSTSRYLRLPVLLLAPFPVLGCLYALYLGLTHYPLNPFLLGGCLLAYGAVLWWRPALWLFLIPALLPLANLALWTGWLFFEELDLFLAVTVVIGYIRLLPLRPSSRMSPIARFFLGSLILSYAISATLGLLPLQPLDANAFNNYLSHYNSLRILKPFLWSILLLPLLSRIPIEKSITHYFVPGLLTGLAGVVLTALWERHLFTGLMNFSSDYRITASFPEMHVGGAALDAFLSITLPFVMYWFLEKSPRSLFHFAVGMLLLSGGLYTVLVTFSRGLYLGLALSTLVISLSMGRRALAGRSAIHSYGILLALYAILGLLFAINFKTGGYRGLFGALCLTGSALYAGGQQVSGKRGAPHLVWSMLLVLFSTALWVTLDKGAYVAVSLSLISVILGGLLKWASPRHAHLSAVLYWGGFLALIPNDLAVNWHWGGLGATVSGAAISLLVLLLAETNLHLKIPLWHWNRQSAPFLLLLLLMISIPIPIAMNYSMVYRFTQSATDAHTREEHWAQSLTMMDENGDGFLFGMGLGRYPENYFWKNKEGDLPGTYQLETGVEGPFLRLEAPKYQAGFGESLRIGQWIFLKPFQSYTLVLVVRSPSPQARLTIEACEKLVLFQSTNQCVTAMTNVPNSSQWKRVEVDFNSSRIGSEPWHERPPVHFSLSNDVAGTLVDIKSVSLKNMGQDELLRNRRFLEGMDHWYFTSDHYHLPWHAKNMELHLFFEQGLLGICAFSGLLFSAIARLARKTGTGDPNAIQLLASLLGLLTVGLFDSVLDFPRLSLLVYLLLYLSLLRPIEKRRLRNTR